MANDTPESPPPARPVAHLAWEGGAAATVTRARGDVLEVRSSVPYPPGKPARGTLSCEGHPAHPLTLKVAGSRKLDEGAWEVRGKLISPTVALREALASSSAAGPDAPRGGAPPVA